MSHSDTPLLSTRRTALGMMAGAGAFVAGGSALASVGGLPLAAATDGIMPFRVDVPQAALDDLALRLAQTRWPEKEPVGDWSQGVPLGKAKALIDYWREQYDWRRFERKINALPQFRTQIDGLGIHFIHVKSRHSDAMPILLTHGWPGSVVEFMEAVGPLTDPLSHGGKAEDAFHVVIPSLPGFGFSDKPVEARWHVPRIAAAWTTLMQRLGYDRWVAQGGDWGAGITHYLAHQRPAGLAAAHVNWPLVAPTETIENPDPEEQSALEAIARFDSDDSGYFRLQSTRPQTIGYALADSPVGQATWIYEKLYGWSDNDGQPEDAFPMDAMLDNITLYWLTNTAASSARIYWQNSRQGPLALGVGASPIDLPMAATIFPREIFRAPRKWAEANWSQLYYWNEVDRGGHFAAFEEPLLFAQEMRAAFGPIR